MVEAVMRAKGLWTLSGDVGFEEVSAVIILSVDSSASTSFVNRRGMSKMKHVEVMDTWLQMEVKETSFVWKRLLVS